MLVSTGLVIDFGNSETRVKLYAGNRCYRFNLSNKFAVIEPGYKVNAKYSNGKSTVLLTNGSYFANGEIVTREFPHVMMRPSALQSKTEQLTTELTLNLAITKSILILSEVYNLPVDQLDITFNISVLLPPLDQEVNEAKLLEKINNLTSVTTLIPKKMDKKFKIGEVNVQSEAVAAFFGAFYYEEGLQEIKGVNDGKSLEDGDYLVYDSDLSHIELVEVENNKKFMQGYVLVLDIGAGTTDVALFLDMELVENSKDTFQRGGNLVQSIVGQEIRKLYGFQPPSLEQVVSTGTFYEGDYAHDVKELVTAAKKQYSKAMMEDIRQYLERMAIPMQIVKGLLVAGGGALATVRDGEEISPAMSEVLMEFLKVLAPRLEPLETKGKDLRTLNIDGLGIIHKHA